jgi:hypothetical protein
LRTSKRHRSLPHNGSGFFFFRFLPSSSQRRRRRRKIKARTKVKRKIKPLQKQRYSAAAVSFSTLPPRRCCFPSQAQQKTEFGSNARERTREESLSLSLSLYRRRGSSRPRLHSVNADTVHKQHRLGFSFFSIFFFSFFGGLGVPVIYLFIYLVISVLCFREFFDFSKILKAFFGRIYF